MWILPAPGHRSRLLVVFYGILLMLWMSTEDSGTLTVTLLGSGLSVLAIGLWLLQETRDRRISFRGLLIGGAGSGGLMGAGAILATVALMFLKTAWHSHIYPDYPPQMMLDMLVRIPAWGLAGGMLGLAGALLWIALQQENAGYP